MSEKTQKFTTKEMEKIKEVQNSYIGIQQAFGQVKVNRMRLEQQMESTIKAEDELRVKFVEIQDDEKDLITELNKKYGDGSLDLESGTFTSNKSN